LLLQDEEFPVLQTNAEFLAHIEISTKFLPRCTPQSPSKSSLDLDFEGLLFNVFFLGVAFVQLRIAPQNPKTP